MNTFQNPRVFLAKWGSRRLQSRQCWHVVRQVVEMLERVPTTSTTSSDPFDPDCRHIRIVSAGSCADIETSLPVASNATTQDVLDALEALHKFQESSVATSPLGVVLSLYRGTKIAANDQPIPKQERLFANEDPRGQAENNVFALVIQNITPTLCDISIPKPIFRKWSIEPECPLPRSVVWDKDSHQFVVTTTSNEQVYNIAYDINRCNIKRRGFDEHGNSQFTLTSEFIPFKKKLRHRFEAEPGVPLQAPAVPRHVLASSSSRFVLMSQYVPADLTVFDTDTRDTWECEWSPGAEKFDLRPVWATTDKYFACLGGDCREVWIYNVFERKFEFKLKCGSRKVYGFRWSPCGRWIAAVSCKKDLHSVLIRCFLNVWDTTTGDVKMKTSWVRSGVDTRKEVQVKMELAQIVWHSSGDHVVVAMDEQSIFCEVCVHTSTTRMLYFPTQIYNRRHLDSVIAMDPTNEFLAVADFPGIMIFRYRDVLKGEVRWDKMVNLRYDVTPGRSERVDELVWSGCGTQIFVRGQSWSGSSAAYCATHFGDQKNKANTHYIISLV